MTETPTTLRDRLAALLAERGILEIDRSAKSVDVKTPLLRFDLDRSSPAHASVHSPLGSLYLHRTYDWDPAWYVRRGRCKELEVGIPLPKGWSLEISTRGQSYRELVGAPKYLENLNWMIDEFDASFNDYATASLRYHLEYSVCDNSDRREVYEDLITRLNEPQPRYTDEEKAVLRPPGWTFEDDLEELFDNRRRKKPTPPEKRAVYDAHRKRQVEHRARIQQARHDFVDIMPELWS